MHASVGGWFSGVPLTGINNVIIGAVRALCENAPNAFDNGNSEDQLTKIQIGIHPAYYCFSSSRRRVPLNRRRLVWLCQTGLVHTVLLLLLPDPCLFWQDLHIRSVS